ncbi:MAG: hypothetical protein R2852_02485 [Bacteroidia bacterium]
MNSLPIKEIEKNKAHILSYNPDEAADFEADEDYLLIVHQSKLALNELKEHSGHSLGLSLINDWLSRHVELYEDCIAYFMYTQHEDFFSLSQLKVPPMKCMTKRIL